MSQLQDCTELIPQSTTNFQFGDRRIDQRGNFILDKMATASAKNLTEIFTSEAELKGAYRFLGNGLVTHAKILAPHSKETIRRCKSQKIIGVIQDSSDLDFDYMKCLEGYGSLHENVQKGFRIHPLLVINSQGTPLGVLNTFNYSRTETNSPKRHRNALPIEEKESFRWLWGYREACKLAEQVPEAMIVSIADREGDIYECLKEAEDVDYFRKAHILVRANHNRSLAEPENETLDKLEKKLIRSPVIYEAKVHLNTHKSNSRIADIRVRASTVMLQAPNTSQKKKFPAVRMNAVLVTEVDPSTKEPLHWLLLTTLPIESMEQVQQIISLYGRRWLIEIYFKVLKSGCKVDSQRLQTPSNIENYIALAMIVAWRVMIATYLPRQYPGVSCSIMFTDDEWKLTYMSVYEDKELPKKVPTLKEMVTWIAILGGYRKRKAPPGIQTIWRGMVRLMDIVYGRNLAKKMILAGVWNEN